MAVLWAAVVVHRMRASMVPGARGRCLSRVGMYFTLMTCWTGPVVVSLGGILAKQIGQVPLTNVELGIPLLVWQVRVHSGVGVYQPGMSLGLPCSYV